MEIMSIMKEKVRSFEDGMWELEALLRFDVTINDFWDTLFDYR